MMIILLLLVVLVAVLVFRANSFKAVDNGPRQARPVQVNGERARKNLSTLVKYETVSNADFDKTDKEVFAAYRRKLKELYPQVTAHSEYRELGNTAMLFKIKGKSDAQPSVLMSHYDVVPVEEDRWENPPFCGEIIDGVLWGRGTLDTKITMVGIMDEGLCCEARAAGEMLAGYAREAAGPCALIWGGETVVRLRGSGMGGRSQELALAAAEGIAGVKDLCLFAVGSDGTDGPTDAAGGMVTGDFFHHATAERVRSHLENNDAYPLLKELGALIVTGPTGTNVNDLYMFIKR